LFSYLSSMCYEKKRRKRKKKAWINAEWPSIGWLRESNVHNISKNTRKKNGNPPPASCCACAHPREPLQGHVISRQNTPKKTAGNPVAHARTQGNSFEVTCTNILYYYYIKKKSAGKIRACTHDHPRDCRSGPLLVMSLTVAPPPQMWLCSHIYITNVAWSTFQWLRRIQPLPGQKTLIVNRAPIGRSAKGHKGENMCNNAIMIISSQM
jgi:hypothetical protein